MGLSLYSANLNRRTVAVVADLIRCYTGITRKPDRKKIPAAKATGSRFPNPSRLRRLFVSLESRGVDLCCRAGRVFLRYLLIQLACLIRLTNFLVERGQQELRRTLAHGNGWMIGELLVDFDGLGIAIGVVIDGSQRQFCQAGNLFE